MSSYPVPRLFTFKEYLKLERASLNKSEFVDGQIFAMAGGNLNHSQIAANALASLHTRLRGTKCRVNGSIMMIPMSKTGPSFYPDISVFCGEPVHLDARKDTLTNPCVIVEVLSGSTASYDRTVKLPRYRKLVSVKSILLIAQDKVEIVHHFRDASGNWEHEVVNRLSGVVDLTNACGVRLPLADIYERVEL